MDFTPDKDQIAYLKQRDRIPDNDLSPDDTQNINTSSSYPSTHGNLSGVGCLIFFIVIIVFLYFMGKE